MTKMLSVVIPAFNEEKRLPATLQQISGWVRQFSPDYEIIVVDDGSVDGTADVVMSLCKIDPGIRLIRYEKNRGKGFAVRTGVFAAKGDFILFSDADLSTPIRELEKLFPALVNGADVAIGSRAVKESVITKWQPPYRVLMGKTFNKIVQILATPGIHDTQCGFKLFSRDAAMELFRDCKIEGFGFDVEVLFLARKRGMEIREIGVEWINSPESKVHPLVDSIRMLKELLMIRQYALRGNYGDLSIRSARVGTVSSK